MFRNFDVLVKEIKELALYTDDFIIPDFNKTQEEIKKVYNKNKNDFVNTFKRVQSANFNVFLTNAEKERWNKEALKDDVIISIKREYGLESLCTNCYSLDADYRMVDYVERVTLPDMMIVLCNGCDNKYSIIYN